MKLPLTMTYDSDPISRLEAHLQSASSRRDFDMHDAEELELLKPFPCLHDAVVRLGQQVTPLWLTADAEALRHQKRHKWLARTAVVTGIGAIVLAVVQLALKQTWPSMTHTAGWLEGIVVLASVMSVFVGCGSQMAGAPPQGGTVADAEIPGADPA